MINSESSFESRTADNLISKHEDRARQRKTGRNKKTQSKTMRILKKIPVILLIAGITIFGVSKIRPDLIYRAVPSSFFKLISGVKSDIKILEQSKLNTEKLDINDFIRGEKVSYNFNLLLINKNHTLESNFEPDLVNHGEGLTLSRGVYEKFTDLEEGLSKTGLAGIHVISTYRTREEQTEAYAEDQVTTAPPGASEHEAGIAIDVCTTGYAGLAFINSETGVWVNENSWKYGFIIRYQKYKDSITGIPFEPWHLRYVGVPHAKIIYEKDFVFEEYLDFLKSEQGKFISTGDYLVTMQKGGKISVPEKYDSASISYTDNGYFIATFKVK